MPLSPQTLRPSRKKLILPALSSLVLVIIGIYLNLQDTSDYYASVIFLGFYFLILLVQLMPQASYLQITEEGFTFCSLFRKQTIPWEIVQGFSRIRVGLNSMTAWNFIPGRFPESKLKSVSKYLSGYDAALPDTYGMKAKELAELMNRYLAQAISTPDHPADK